MDYDENSFEDLPSFSIPENNAERNDSNEESVLEGDFISADEPQVVKAYFIVDETNVVFGESFMAYRDPAKVYNDYIGYLSSDDNTEKSIKIYARHVEISLSELNGVTPLKVNFDEYVERVDASSLIFENDSSIDVDEQPKVEPEQTEPRAFTEDAVEAGDEPSATADGMEATVDAGTIENDVIKGTAHREFVGTRQFSNEIPFEMHHQSNEPGQYFQERAVSSAPDSKAGLMQGGAHVVEGVGNLVAGGAVLIGSAAREAGNLMKAIGSGIRHFSENRTQGELLQSDISALIDGPEVSSSSATSVAEHMVSELQQFESNYCNVVESLWKTHAMKGLHEQIKEVARIRGVDAADVIQALPNDSELTEIYDKVKSTLDTDPEAREIAEKSNQHLNDWCDAYESLQERKLRSTEPGEREELDGVLTGAKSSMEKAASVSPVFDDEERSHLQKLVKLVQQMMERIKEFMESLMKKREEQPSPSL